MALIDPEPLAEVFRRIEEDNRKRLYATAKQQQEIFARFPIENDVEIRVIGIVDVKKDGDHGNRR